MHAGVNMIITIRSKMFMKKKILSVILTIAMILSTLSVPMAVFADSNTVQYHYHNNNCDI